MVLRPTVQKLTAGGAGAVAVLASIVLGGGTAQATPQTFTCRTTQVIPGGSLYARVCLQYEYLLGTGPVFITRLYITSNSTAYTFGNSSVWNSGSDSSGFNYYDYYSCNNSSVSHQLLDTVQVCSNDWANDGHPYQQGQAFVYVDGRTYKVYSPTVPAN